MKTIAPLLTPALLGVIALLLMLILVKIPPPMPTTGEFFDARGAKNGDQIKALMRRSPVVRVGIVEDKVSVNAD